jgi:UDP-3-O-[3-hydroxymyristoyl] glucosamine N-acyltransferase
VSKAAVGTRGETIIHPTALVDEDAELGQGVVVGPWAIVGPRVRVGDGTEIGPRVLIERDTEVGEDCRLANGAVLGTDPQDLKFKGEDTILEVGDRTVIREFATLNRGTLASGRTAVGSDCLLMAYTHVAHDCELGNHVILSNSVNMAGHVTIEDWVIVGGLCASGRTRSWVEGRASPRMCRPTVAWPGILRDCSGSTRWASSGAVFPRRSGDRSSRRTAFCSSPS